MRLDKLTTKFQEALADAQSLALANDHAYIEPPHLLAAMLRQEDGPRALLQGDRLLREGKCAQAIRILEQAAQLLPKDARAWNHLGLAYHGAGRAEDAVKAYQQDRGVQADGIVGDQTWWAPAGAAGATLASLSGLTTV